MSNGSLRGTFLIGNHAMQARLGTLAWTLQAPDMQMFNRFSARHYLIIISVRGVLTERIRNVGRGLTVIGQTKS